MSPQVKAVIAGGVLSLCGYLLYDYHAKTEPTKSAARFYWELLTVQQVPVLTVVVFGLLVYPIMGFALSFLREKTVPTPEISEIQGPEETQSVQNHQVAHVAQVDTPKLMTIDRPIYPSSRDSFPFGRIAITGTYSGNPPPGWRFALFTRRDDTYWPKGRFRDNHDGTWTCPIEENHEGETQLVAAQVADGVYLWVNLYGYVGNKYKEWVGQRLDILPSSIHVDEVTTIKIGPKT